MTKVQSVSIQRVYGDLGRVANEYRVLVDRLWPRGKTKAAVDADEWAKDVTPTPTLRQWYAHEVARFDEFAERYRDELAGDPQRDVVERLVATSLERPLVLLTASRDLEHSSAEVLRSALVAPTIRHRATRSR